MTTILRSYPGQTLYVRKVVEKITRYEVVRARVGQKMGYIDKDSTMVSTSEISRETEALEDYRECTETEVAFLTRAVEVES